MSRSTKGRFADDVALVTGAGSGIGAATARRLAAEGAHVVVTDVDEAGGESTVADIEDAGGSASFAALDVTDADAVGDVVAATVERHGGLDVLVNNAGVLGPSGPVEEVDAADWQQVLAVDVEGVWNGTRAALPALRESGGAVVNVASVAGLRGSPGLAAYSLAKGAVVSFTRAVAGEVGDDGVRVNCVAPGSVETPLTSDLREGDEGTGLDESGLTGSISLGRLGDPEEIASSIAFLASEEASYVTGECLVVDGGYSATLR